MFVFRAFKNTTLHRSSEFCLLVYVSFTPDAIVSLQFPLSLKSLATQEEISL